MNHLIAPSILSADFSRLGEDITMLDKSSADWIHIDVMDGAFVPNISFGFPIIKSIRKYTKKVFDVHLMIEQPEKYIAEFADAGADVITVHYEAVPHLHRVVQSIKEKGVKAGVAINPHTPVQVLEEILPELDLVLIMSVNPGFGGQSFIRNTVKKIEKLKFLLANQKNQPLIEVDGGISIDNAPDVLRAGANVLVAGNSIFKTDNPAETINTFKSISINTYSV